MKVSCGARGEARAADAHAIVAALDFKLRNSRFRCQIDQLTDFIDSHQSISLTYFRRSIVHAQAMRILAPAG